MSEKGKPSDRRKHHRHQSRDDLQLLVGMENARTINVSLNGALCIMPRYFPPFTKLDLMIMIPIYEAGEVKEQRPLVAQAIVIRIDPEVPSDDIEEYQIAFYFPHLDDLQREVISSYLNELPLYEGDTMH